MAQSEAQLLAEYSLEQDAEAFRCLVEEHQHMVFAVCSRILGNEADAEDAAQHCFFQLARKADRLKAPIAGWLHHVAVQVSFDILRKRRTRRRREEAAAARRAKPREPCWEAIRDVVDEGIDALPKRLREPLVLHFLESKAQAEVAAELGISQPTVSRRIRRAVELLRKRLRKAGFIATGAALASLLTAHAPLEGAPPALSAALGKMAVAGLSGGNAATGVAATAAGTGVGAGGVSVLKAVLVGVVAASAIIAGGAAYKIAQKLEQEPATTAPAAQLEGHEEPAPADFSDNDLIWTLKNLPPLFYEIPLRVKDFRPPTQVRRLMVRFDLVGTIRSDRRVDGPFKVAFFGDPAWQTEPLEVLTVDAPEFSVEFLPADAVWIAVLAGDPGKLKVLGVHSTWPEPVKPDPGGGPVRVEVLVSGEIARIARGYIQMLAAGLSRPETTDPQKLVQGYVYGADGLPIKHALIAVTEGRTQHTLRTDEHGHYAFPVPEAPYSIGVVHYLPQPHVPGFSVQKQQMAGLRSARGPRTHNFRLGPIPTGKELLDVSVVDGSGRPARRFGLFLTRREGEVGSVDRLIAVIDRDGTARVADLPPGTYHVACYHPGRAAGREYRPVQVGGAAVAATRFVLEEGSAIHFSVVSAADSKPVAGAMVWSGRMNGPLTVRHGKAGENGLVKATVDRQTLDAIKRGELGFFVFADGYRREWIGGDVAGPSPETAHRVELHPLPLHSAARYGELEKVKTLLKADPDLARSRNSSGRTPLHEAALRDHGEAIKVLLAHGADVDVTDNRGWTPLKLAATIGAEETVRFLLAGGADINAGKRRGWTPLHAATQGGQKRMVEILLDAGADAASLDRRGRTPYDLALEKGHDEVAELLRARAVPFNIHAAAKLGDLERVKAFAAEDPASINAQDESQRTPLHYAAARGHLAVVEFLLTKGAQINALDGPGRTPLQLAVKNGHEEVAGLLRARGGIE